MKGFVTLYLNTEVAPEGSDMQSFFDMVRNGNKELVEELKAEGYSVLFVPVNNESSRVEKTELNVQSQQLPVNAHGLKLNSEEAKNNLMKDLKND